MSFDVPDSAPRIVFTHSGTQHMLAVSMVPVPIIGPTLGLFKLTPQGWNAIWQHGPQQLGEWEAQVTAAGSVRQLITSFVEAINKAIRTLLGIGGSTEPLPPGASVDALIQEYLERNFGFALNADNVPLFNHK